MRRLDLKLSAVLEIIGSGEIQGDPDFHCASVARLDKAGPSDLSFVRNRTYEEDARASHAGALLVSHPIEGYEGHQLVVDQPDVAFAHLLATLSRQQREQPAGVHPSAIVDPGAVIGEDVRIGPGAVVREGARIGDRCVLYAHVYVGPRCTLGHDCILYPNVVLVEDVEAGDRVIVQPGAVIACDGYGYIQQEGRHLRAPHVGRVVIGDDVEIGALATIDRAMVDRTEIGRGTKIGDLVHVAHNCIIGEDVLLLPMVGVSGSVTVGDRAILAGKVGISGHIKIGEDAVLGAASVAYKDVEPGSAMWGNPARDKSLQMRIQSLLNRLPQLFRDVRDLKKKIGED